MRAAIASTATPRPGEIQLWNSKALIVRMTATSTLKTDVTQ